MLPGGSARAEPSIQMTRETHTEALQGFTHGKLAGLFALLLMALLLQACAVRTPNQQNEAAMTAHPIAPGEFFTVEEGVAQPLDRAAFLTLAEEADYILIGEGHPIRCDHEAQATIMRWLAGSRGSGPAIALEMVGLDRQGDLDAFLRGELNAADLREALDWKRTWGHDFFAYGPVFATAEQYHLPLYAVNLPPGAAFAYGRGGVDAVAPLHRQYLPQAIIPAGKAQREDLRSVFERHVAMMKARRPGQNETTDATDNGTDNATVGAPEARESLSQEDARKGGSENATRDASTFSKHDKTDDSAAAGNGTAPVMPAPEGASPGHGQANATARRPDPEAMFHQFITVQSLWDTVMAENAVRVRKLEGSPVVVLAGSGHVENGWGIALRLQSLDPGAKVLLVMPWRADPADELPPAGLGDVFFSCPLPPDARTMGPPPGASDDSTTGDGDASGPGASDARPTQSAS